MPFLRLLGTLVAAVCLSLPFVLIAQPSAHAEPSDARQGALVSPGDTAMTGFSGTVLASESLPPGVDPLDRTFIDISGPAFRLFDLKSLDMDADGRLVVAPLKLEIPASTIGQVFGIAVEDFVEGAAPNLYVAASSTFGIQIVGAATEADGKPTRLKQGAADARFMEGQFDTLSGNSPGAIYRIDGATGDVTLFADTGFGKGTANSGPGLGALAYERQSRVLFASDLDTGLIHRFGLDFNAANLGTFDHGVAGRRAAGLDPAADDGKTMEITAPEFKVDDPDTWGLTPPQRRIHGLAVHDGRLYYAVAEGPEIWSVSLSGGDFGNDPRRELSVKAKRPFPITGIAFNQQGRMILSQRGVQKGAYDYEQFVDPGPAQVLRYTLKDASDGQPRAWRPEPEEYAVGLAEDSRAAAGGISLQHGYGADGRIDLSDCDGTLVTTGETFVDAKAPVAGLQILARDGVRPANGSPQPGGVLPYEAPSVSPDLRGHMGNVAAVRRCDGAAGFPPVAEGGGFPPVADGGAFPPVEGAAVEMPPVVDEEEVGDDFPPVEEEAAAERATNLAIEKTQNCRLEDPATAECEYQITITNTSDVPFDLNSAEVPVQDRFSVAPTRQIVNMGNAERSEFGFDSLPSLPTHLPLPPGPLPDPGTVTARFAVPPGGLTVENCVSLRLPAAGTPLPGAFTPPEAPPPSPDLPASTTNGRDRGISISGSPQCVVRGDLRDCSWTVTLFNPGTEAAPATFSLRFPFSLDTVTAQIAAPELHGRRLTDNTELFININENGTGVQSLPPRAQRSFVITMTIPADQGSVQAIASVADVGDLDQDRFEGDINRANDEAAAEAGANAPEVLDSPGVVSADADPSDNTSCITWNSNDPDNQGVPVNAPAEAVPPPAAATGLRIEKRALVTTCSDVGGGCLFEVVVSNPGPDDFAGPAEILDTVTVDGRAIASTQLLMIQAGPADGWRCAKQDAAFMCSREGPIKAGESIVLRRNAFLQADTGGGARIENCAELRGTDTRACAEILLSQNRGARLRPSKRLVSGDCAENCEFALAVTNEGATAYKGPVAIMDSLTDQQTNQGVPARFKKTSGAQFACNTAGTSFFVCNAKEVELQPGTSVEVRVSMRIDQVKVAANNCVRAGPPAVADNDQPVGRCVPIAFDRQVPNLALTKVAEPVRGLPGGTCRLEGVCPFRISVRNKGTADYTGKLIVLDTVSSFRQGQEPVAAAARYTSLPESWTCTPSGNVAQTLIRCEQPEMTLKPGESRDLIVSLRTTSDWKKNNFIRNCGLILHDPAGNDPNTIRGDNEDCDFLKLDPFALEIRKRGDQSCVPGGTCTFELDIVNRGPILHDDPVTVIDGLTGLAGAPIFSLTPDGKSAPFPCVPAPTSIPFQCSGHMRLEVGDSHTYHMTVRIPEDAPGAGAFRNCAIISAGGADAQLAPAKTEEDARMLAEARGPAREHVDCHSVALSPATSSKSPPPVAATPQCAGGMVLNAQGLCACPARQSWSGRACREKGPGTGGATHAQPPRPEEAREEPAPSPRPETGPGSGGISTTAPGTQTCPPGRPIGTYPICCPAGTVFRAGRCQRPAAPPLPVPEPVQTCPRGTRGTYPDCRCPLGMVGTPPNCCPRGMQYEDGRCRRPQADVCTGGQVGTPPNCVCPPGTRYHRVTDLRTRGKQKCVTSTTTPPPPPPESKTCPLGQRGTYPNCLCPLGMSGTPPNCCPPGTRYVNGKCQRPAPPPVPDPGCTGGQVGTPPNCVCPPGKRYSRAMDRRTNGRQKCVDAATPTPPPGCTGGQVGTPPNCTCPPGTRYSRAMDRRTNGRQKCIPATEPTTPGRPKCGENEVLKRVGPGRYRCECRPGFVRDGGGTCYRNVR